MERVEIKTFDNKKIVGNHYKGLPGSPGVLLLHMMPATKESWDEFAKQLHDAGFGVFAIDLRGHGESEGGPDGYKSFSDAEHQSSIQDVRAGTLFQKNEGHNPLFVVGASIGANFTLQILAENESIKGAVLLSAGTNYRGVETLSSARKVRSHQGVYIIAAKDDMRGNGRSADEMAREIFNTIPSEDKKIEIFETGEHGTDLFMNHSDLKERIIMWLESKL